MSGKRSKSGVLATAEPVHDSLTATEAQNNFGRMLGRAKRGGRVFITRYDRPEAVLLSIEEFEALTGQEPVDLQGLEREFDAMLRRMQQPAQQRAADQLFAMTGPELGKAALGVGPSRGRRERKPTSRGTKRTTRRR